MTLDLILRWASGDGAVTGLPVAAWWVIVGGCWAASLYFLWRGTAAINALLPRVVNTIGQSAVSLCMAGGLVLCYLLSAAWPRHL